MPETVIETERLVVRYRGKAALDGLDLRVPRGAVYAFLGDNGAGKTTTMKILTCFMPATYGTARVDGFDVFESPMEVKRRIGYLPDQPPIYPELTVKSYLHYVAELKEVPYRERKGRVLQVMRDTRIDHVAAHTTSEEDYRGVAGGRGRGVFNGKVIVRPDAQKIDARQSSRNLLLNDGAEIDTKPELEIYANDVKCSHGATTGQLDATALFYLRSRGLSESEARILLIRAFAESILRTIEHAPVRSWLEQRLSDRYALPEVPA